MPNEFLQFLSLKPMQVNAVWSSTQVVVHDKVAVPVKEPPQAQDDTGVL